MKILLADPDRDFVWSYREILEQSGNEVTTAYDGAQVINKAFTDKYDQVIMSSEMPRVNRREILQMLNSEKCPVILLMTGRVNSDILLDEVLANAHISFPFFPGELTRLSDEVLKKKNEKQKLSFAEIELDVGGYMLCGKLRVTNEEIDVLSALINKTELDSKRAGPYIGSLNNKLERLNKKTRIRYVMKEGYRLVTDYE